MKSLYSVMVRQFCITPHLILQTYQNIITVFLTIPEHVIQRIPDGEFDKDA